MSYGVFEAAATDGHEEEVAADRRNKAINAAIFDVRESYEEFVCAAADKEDFSDRIALVKNDMMKTVAQTLMPVPGVMRKVEGALKASWKDKSKKSSVEELAWMDDKTFLDYARNLASADRDSYLWRDISTEAEARGLTQQVLEITSSKKVARTDEQLRDLAYDFYKFLADAGYTGQQLIALDPDVWDELALDFVGPGQDYDDLSDATALYAPGGPEFFADKKASVAGELGDVSDEELLEIFNTATDNDNFDVMMTALQELQSRGLGDQAVNRGASRKQADVSFEGWALEEVSGSEGIEYYAVINKTTGQEEDRVYPYQTDSDGLWEPLTVAEQEAELNRIVEEFGDPRYSKKEAVNFRDVEPLDGGIWNIETWDSTMTAQVSSRADGNFDYEIYDSLGNYLDGETVSSLELALNGAKGGIEFYDGLTSADLDPEADDFFTDQEW